MDNELAAIAGTFELPTCDGTQKLFKDFTTWELLNMDPSDILDIPNRLYESRLISSSFLENSLKPYLVHATGKEKLEEYFEIDTPTAYITSATMHYSWGKSAGTNGCCPFMVEMWT
jgi:hypothetical protein